MLVQYSYLLEIFLKLNLSWHLFVAGAGYWFTSCNFGTFLCTCWLKIRLMGLLRVPSAEDHILNSSVCCLHLAEWPIIWSTEAGSETAQSCIRSALCSEWGKLCCTRGWSSLQSVWLVPAFFCSILKGVFTAVFVLTVECLSAVMFCVFSKMPKNCLRKLNKVRIINYWERKRDLAAIWGLAWILI